MSPTKPSDQLQAWLHARQLLGDLRVLATNPWVDVQAAIARLNVKEITTEAVWAYVDLPTGGIKEVETLDHGQISAYFREYSTTTKMYKTMGGPTDMFKEFSILFMTVAMLHQNPYTMPKGKGSLLIT